MNPASLPSGWAEHLAGEFRKPYLRELSDFVQRERRAGPVFPESGQVFAALEQTPLEQVRVVILGQDPYHTPGMAMGLAFSVQPHATRLPPSLRNMFTELVDDLGVPQPSKGDLRPWAEQGVLLLNTVLTVREGAAHSHAKRGWETFTDQVIRTVAREQEGVVFLLWGAHAQSKQPLLDGCFHRVIKSNHPSPLSARRPPVPFLGSRPYSTANQTLVELGHEPIHWQLP